MINLTYPVDLLNDCWSYLSPIERNQWINHLESLPKYRELHQIDVDIEIMKQHGSGMAGRLRDLYNDRANLLIDLRAEAINWVFTDVKIN